jgi:hypothetical protein
MVRMENTKMHFLRTVAGNIMRDHKHNNNAEEFGTRYQYDVIQLSKWTEPF